MIWHSLLLILHSLSTLGGKHPVEWEFSAQKLKPQEYQLTFTASIQDGWTIYSQYLSSDDGPIKTSISYNPGQAITLIGKNEESGDIIKAMDELFGMELIKIKHKGVFSQKIKVKDPSIPITGVVEYMCCNSVQCLPPKQIPFTIHLPAGQ
jgi:hypothetical protein